MKLGIQNKAVRDIAWVIGSTPLMNSKCIDEPLAIGQHAPHLYNFFSSEWFQDQWTIAQDWLLELEKDPTPLNETIEKKNYQRLGKYFECLIQFWLEHHPFFTLKASGLQLFQNKKTIGEVDFILYDQIRRQWCHWEVAVKFYLGWKSEGDWHSWIGPNALDRLDLKMEKLLKHQLPLLSTPIGRETLNQLNIQTIHPQSFLKGGFFYPLNPDYQCLPPIASEPQHYRGWWVHLRDLDYLLDLPNRAWKLLTRLEWLSGIPNQAIDQLIATKGLPSQIDHYFNNYPNAVMLAEFSEISDGIWKEVRRGFIVPNQWPGKK